MTHVREMLDMKLKREDIKNKDVETIIVKYLLSISGSLVRR